MKSMMKKIIGLLVALMMLTVSVCALAEETVPAAEEDNIISRAVELLKKGCAITAESTVKVGEGIDALASENDKEILGLVKELLDGMKIRCSAQMVEDQYQISYAILFGEEKLADFVISRSGDVLMVASNFIGEDVIGVTKDELKQLMNEELTVNGAALPKNVSDQIVDWIFLDTKNLQVNEETAAEMVKSIEELANKLLPSIEENMTVNSGETLLVDGSQTGPGVVVKVSRETLTEFVKEFAGTVMKASGTEVSDTELEAAGNILQSDLEVRVYATEADTVAVIETAVGPTPEEAVNMHGEYVFANNGTNIKSINVLKSVAEDLDVTVGGKLQLTDDSTVGFGLNLAQTANGKKTTLADIGGNLSIVEQGQYIGTYSIMNMEMTGNMRMKSVKAGTGKYTDETVTYEAENEIYMAPDMSQPIFTANETLSIDLAEAYLNPETALMIGQLDEAGMADLGTRLTQNATVELMRIITVLPESIQQLLMGGMF